MKKWSCTYEYANRTDCCATRFSRDNYRPTFYVAKHETEIGIGGWAFVADEK
jgi:hypothetical protein